MDIEDILFLTRISILRKKGSLIEWSFKILFNRQAFFLTENVRNKIKITDWPDIECCIFSLWPWCQCHEPRPAVYDGPTGQQSDGWWRVGVGARGSHQKRSHGDWGQEGLSYYELSYWYIHVRILKKWLILKNHVDISEIISLL